LKVQIKLHFYISKYHFRAYQTHCYENHKNGLTS